MRKTSALLLIGALAIGTARPAIAHDTETGYASRGACEAASTQMSQGEVDWLLDIGAQYFDTVGDVNSFLTRAWTCDRNPADGQYYMTDHIHETLDSEWFAQRNH